MLIGEMNQKLSLESGASEDFIKGQVHVCLPTEVSISGHSRASSAVCQWQHYLGSPLSLAKPAPAHFILIVTMRWDRIGRDYYTHFIDEEIEP